nr:hypothetical protein [Tanacetum cinerariifolium]
TTKKFDSLLILGSLDEPDGFCSRSSLLL